MKKFGGVKVIARPVMPEALERRGFSYFTRPEGVAMTIPFAGGKIVRHTTPNHLDYAAQYLAAVLCELNDHQHGDGYRWYPCEQSIRFALDQIHKLAQHKFPVVSQAKEPTWQREKQGEPKASGKPSAKRSAKKRR